MSRQRGISKVWSGAADPLEIGIFIFTAYQLGWTMVTFASEDATDMDKYALCGMGVLLLLLGNTLVAKFKHMTALSKIAVIPIIAGIMFVSIITSQLHFASMFHGGYVENIKNSDQYRRATTRYELAMNELQGAQESAAIADKQGKIRDAGYIRRKQVTAAKASVIKAEQAMEVASQPGGADDSKASALNKTAQFFGLAPLEFITYLWLFVAALLEFGRLKLTLASASEQEPSEDSSGNHPAAEPEPIL